MEEEKKRKKSSSPHKMSLLQNQLDSSSNHHQENDENLIFQDNHQQTNNLQQSTKTKRYWTFEMDVILSDLVEELDYDFDEISDQINHHQLSSSSKEGQDEEQVTSEECRERWCDLDYSSPNIEDDEDDPTISFDNISSSSKVDRSLSHIPHYLLTMTQEERQNLTFDKLMEISSSSSSSSNIEINLNHLPSMFDFDDDSDEEEEEEEMLDD